ncbi:AP-5 complex subunit zeta-1 [Saguinus oedipus]|uniref:AP-5 complex subunit zeta-1 n=1 Tax=Saguinus oedipus TaxID=9490 RepID=A0ABQ9W9J0_SAGOE|nr:AP-5 complex subunit zeta-1 [Saguinus oedipus]
MAGCARVAQCAEAVPTLLQVFFSAVTQVSPLPGAPHSHNQGASQSQPAGSPELCRRLIPPHPLSTATCCSPGRPRPPCWQVTSPILADPIPTPVPAGPVPLSQQVPSTSFQQAPSPIGGKVSSPGTGSTAGAEQAYSGGGAEPVSDPDPQVADGALTNQLALLLLDRSNSLYPAPGYTARVHRVLSSQFLALCKLKPSLVVELARDLLEFLGSVNGLRSRASLVTSVVWAIGEYLSVTYDRRCTVEQINKFFEALEALLFEVAQCRPSATLPGCPPQVVTVLMTTLTKLASRSQDLIPRCLGREAEKPLAFLGKEELRLLRTSLLLSKMRNLAQSPATSSTHSKEGVEAIRTRATELLTLLKMPSVAQFVFTPSTEVCSPRYHRDVNTALPLALRTVSRLVEREAGLLPG